MTFKKFLGTLLDMFLDTQKFGNTQEIFKCFYVQKVYKLPDFRETNFESGIVIFSDTLYIKMKMLGEDLPLRHKTFLQ